MGFFSSDAERAPSRFEFRNLQRRLTELNIKCNGQAAAQQADPSSLYEVTSDMLANKTPYEQEEVRMAMALREFRDTMQREADLKKGKSIEQQMRHPGLTQIRQSLRKQDMKMKELQRNLINSAKTDKEKARGREAMLHLGNMRKRYDESKEYLRRSAMTTDDPVDVSNAGLVPSPDRGDNTTRLVVHDLDQVNAGRNLREDEEFNIFFEQLARNDQAMDAALDRIAAGVTVLHDQALRINQELKVQEVLLDETQRKVDKTTEKVLSLNKKVNKAIKEVEKDRLCIYLICFVLLLGLAGFILYSTGVVGK